MILHKQKIVLKYAFLGSQGALCFGFLNSDGYKVELYMSWNKHPRKGTESDKHFEKAIMFF